MGQFKAVLRNARISRGTGEWSGEVVKTERPLSARSQQMVWGLMRQVLEYARREKWLAENPLAERNIGRPVVQRLVDPQTGLEADLNCWDDEQRRAFLADARVQGDPDYAYYVTLANLGCRSGEGAGLLVSDLDFDSKDVSITKQLLVTERVLGALKNSKKRRGNGARGFKMPSVVVEALKVHLAKPRKVADPKYAPFVFLNEEGTPVFTRNINKRFQAHAARLGLPVITLHGLRHTCATSWAGRGMDRSTLAYILGDNIETVDRYYTHVTASAVAKAAKLMEDERFSPS